jgi:phosphoribosyl 1,2-cyclic phosphate phosphodiesterase
MLKMTFLGTGTSHGVPVIGCDCRVCRSEDQRNKRMRASVLIEHDGHRYLVDTGQEFRLQALRAGIDSLDAVFYTHDHADHLYGIDDLRALTFGKKLPVYGAEDTIDQIRHRFAYIFESDLPGGGVPSLDLRIMPREPLVLDGLTVTPVPIYHGRRIIYGYRFGSIAYLTDCSGIPESSYELLRDLDVLVVGALRWRSHPTHYSVPEAIAAIERIRPRQAYLTHMCHILEHEELDRQLPENISPAYDGLIVTVD